MADYRTSSTLSIPLPPPDDFSRLSSGNPAHMLNTMETFEHSMDMHFGADSFLTDLNTDMPSLGFTPTYDLEAFSSTFEDPFSDQIGRYYASAANETALPQDAAAPSDELENKLLSFSAPLPKSAVLELDGSQSWPAMTAELNGMFFVAEDVFGGEAGVGPMELTCYRRNLFQISGTVTLSRNIAQIVNEQGQQLPIYGLQATLSAVESIDDKSTEIITVPWKSNTTGGSEDKAGTTPPMWPLDLSSNPELDPLTVSIPIAWKRLQFKHATANNGRRKGLQQHYVIQINLMATLATGEVLKLSEIRSSPIIVRGRNPGNFGSSREVPLSEKTKQRTSSNAEAAVKPDFNAAQSLPRNQPLNAMQQQLDLAEWESPTPAYTATETPHRQSTRPTLNSRPSSGSISNSNGRPPVPKTRWTTDNATLTTSSTWRKSSSTAPIDLSLFDDSTPSASSHYQPQTLHFTKRKTSSPPSKKSSKQAFTSALGANTANTAASSVEKVVLTLNSPAESADLLYEYFPLSIDDWMPPVDAIYRPHVVHHTAAVPEAKGQILGGRRKMKRYFSAGEDD